MNNEPTPPRRRALFDVEDRAQALHKLASLHEDGDGPWTVAHALDAAVKENA